MRKYLLVCLLSLAMFGCGSSEKRDVPVVKEYELKHKYYKELIIRSPRLSVLGDYLIVSSSERDTVCRFYAIAM